MPQPISMPAPTVGRLPLHAGASPGRGEGADSWIRDRRWILLLVLGFSGLLFVASTVRHQSFRSGAMDLGFFDQLVFLISRGEPPISSILHFHLLADHAAYVVYLLAPLYWVFSDVHMLLAAQSVALASGAYPLWRMARMRGLSERHALAIATSYALYPLVLAAALFDFHPETLSVPAILFAVLFAQEKRWGLYLLALVVALGGKEIVGLTIAAMGAWLFVFERRRSFGVVAVLAGFGWFVVSTQWVIPHFGAGKEASGLRYYSYLGDSVRDVIVNAVTQPDVWIPVVFSVRTLKYLCVLFLPVCWGLSPRRAAPLLCAAPTFGMNVLAYGEGVDLTNPFSQYSLMIIPFVALTILATMCAGESLLRRPRTIIAWSVALVMLGASARLLRVRPPQPGALEDQVAARQAIDQIETAGGVLTTGELTPHLSQRPLVQYIDPARSLAPLESFEYVLLNLGQASARSSTDLTAKIKDELDNHPAFELAYQRNRVYLFRRDRPVPPRPPDKPAAHHEPDSDVAGAR